MLLGCGCNCEDYPLSSELIGSQEPSSLAQSNSQASVLTPPTACGACYNFPARWQVDVQSNWFKFTGVPTVHNDCKYLFGGRYTLYSVGTSLVKDYGGGLGETVCQVWHSGAVAIYTNKFNPNGTPSVPCRSNSISHPRMQLVAIGEPGNPGLEPTTFFLTFYWTHIPGFQFESWDGWIWSWSVKQPPNGINCVRAFTANFRQGYINSIQPVYSPDPAVYGWQQVSVRPAP